MRFVVKFVGSLLLSHLCLSFCYVSKQVHLTICVCAFSLELLFACVINSNFFHFLPIYRLKCYQLPNYNLTQSFANKGFLQLFEPTFLVPFLKPLTQNECQCRTDWESSPYLANKSAMKSIFLICLAQTDPYNSFVYLD